MFVLSVEHDLLVAAISIAVRKTCIFISKVNVSLYGKQLFTWLSLVVSLMASFVLSFFPLDVLDEIWDLIESVSEGFLTYSFKCDSYKMAYKEKNICLPTF